MNIAASLYLVIHNLYSSLRIFLPWSHNYAGNESAKIWKENRSACCCNNNVNAFLTCTTRSTLVCAQLIIVPLIYSLYFSPSRWLEPSPCLHSLRSGVLCSLWGGKKREVFRHAIGRERTPHDAPRGRDVEIKWTRKRTALIGAGVVAFMLYPTIRICWGINRNMHAPSISRTYGYHRRLSDINVECAECV